MKIAHLVAATISGLACTLAASAALSQSYPVSDDFTDFEEWTKSEESLGGSVSTGFAGGDVYTTLSVDRYNIGDESVFDFNVTHIVYEPGFSDSYKGSFGKDIGDQVSVSIDGTKIPVKSATMTANEEGGISVSLIFADDEDQNQAWDANCRVVTALMNGRDIRVGFEPNHDGYRFTGKGSTRALADLRC